jgi:glycosyltransferase involved in cell wall biosynthesis
MRVGLYNRFWRTAGGAEKYGGAIAEILQRDHEVTLLVNEPVDLDFVGERLQLDLSGVQQVEVPFRPGVVAATSADYDLFVNVSYMSSDRSKAPHGIYVVHFPATPEAALGSLQRAAVRALTPLRGRMPVGMEWGEGFHHRDASRRSTMWTCGDASLRFFTEPGQQVPVELTFSDQRPAALRETTVQLLVDGELVTEVPLRASSSKVRALRGTTARVLVSSRDDGLPVELRIVSDSFVPSDVLGGDDSRELGVPLRRVRVGSGVYSRLAGAFPVLLTPTVATEWIDSYDVVVANSRFTRHWVDRYWGATSEVLYPPVSPQSRGEKERVILGVGRFFEASMGHSKKQLELVRTFVKMCDAGLTGWTLHLAGGCESTAAAYLDEVRAAAVGHPVEIHVNASGATLRDLYAKASIYWHAAGLGANQERHPERLEHFGITTVEAMSAGAAPVVFAAAGQLETVRHGVDGYHFRTLDELADLTSLLIGDPAMLERMSASSEQRAKEFSIETFGDQLGALVDRVVGGDQ